MENVFINTEKVKIKLENFDGPLDLLLQLIKNNKMEITDIKISEITEQYFDVLENIDLNFDMEKATDFLNIATILLEIKSKHLLPQEVVEIEDYEDPEEMLKIQLMEYKLFKDAAVVLKEQENINKLYRPQSKNINNAKIVFNSFDYEKLLDAFASVLSRAKKANNEVEVKTIKKDRWTVAEKIESLKSILLDNDEIDFFDLFDNNYSVLEIITIFLAILELLKFQHITVKQDDKYSNIKIIRKEKEDEDRTNS